MENSNIDGYEISICGHLKYLGVKLNNKLSFRQHMSMVSEKALSAATKLGRIMAKIKGPGEKIRKHCPEDGKASGPYFLLAILYVSAVFAKFFNQCLVKGTFLGRRTRIVGHLCCSCCGNNVGTVCRSNKGQKCFGDLIRRVITS